MVKGGVFYGCNKVTIDRLGSVVKYFIMIPSKENTNYTIPWDKERPPLEREQYLWGAIIQRYLNS